MNRDQVVKALDEIKDWLLHHGGDPAEDEGLADLLGEVIPAARQAALDAPPPDERVRLLEEILGREAGLICAWAKDPDKHADRLKAWAAVLERRVPDAALTPTPAEPSPGAAAFAAVTRMVPPESPDFIDPDPLEPAPSPDAAPSPGAPTCIHCGKPATCIGRYEDATEDAPACSECCGHGNEDGHCEPIAAPSPDAATGGEDEEEEFKPEDICTRCRATRAEHSGRDAYDRSCEAFTMATPAPSKPSAPAPEAVVPLPAAHAALRILAPFDKGPGHANSLDVLAQNAVDALSAATAENARLREERDEAREAARIAEKTCGDLRREAAIWDANVGAALRAKLSASETRCAGLQREHDLTARVATEQRQRAEELAAKLAEAAEELREERAARDHADVVAEDNCREMHRERKRADAAEARAKDLEAFKQYVHDRLDKAGIPTHPDGEHSKAGCRVGDRLDIALDAERRIGEAVEEERKRCAVRADAVFVRWGRPEYGLLRGDVRSAILTPPGEKDNNSSNHGGSTR